MQRALFSILILLFGTSAFSQDDYLFQVLFTKGQVSLNTNGVSAEVKTGDALNVGQEIVLSDDGYIGLVHRSGKLLEFNEAGTYVITDLDKELANAPGTESQKYGQLIAERLLNPESTRVDGVSRAAGSAGKIKLVLPQQVELLGGVCILRWGIDLAVEIPTYKVQVNDIFGSPLMEMETSESKIDIAIDDLKNEMGLYVLNVSQSGDEKISSGEHTIKKLKESDVPDVVSSLDKLKSEMSGDSPLEVLILASFYEENELLLDAIREYEIGTERFPEVKGFYEMFLEAYQLNQ